MTQNTVLYRAQVAVEGSTTGHVDSNEGASSHATGNDTIQSTTDRRPTAARAPGTRNGALHDNHVVKQSTPSESAEGIVIDSDIGKFSITRREDKKRADIRAILVLSGKLIVSDSGNNKLKLFDTKGNYVSSIDSRHQVRGITIVNNDRFATCGLDMNISLWMLRGEIIVAEEVMFKVDHVSHSIHYNGTCFCVLHQSSKAITVLDIDTFKVLIVSVLNKVISHWKKFYHPGIKHYHFGIIEFEVPLKKEISHLPDIALELSDYTRKLK